MQDYLKYFFYILQQNFLKENQNKFCYLQLSEQLDSDDSDEEKEVVEEPDSEECQEISANDDSNSKNAEQFEDESYSDSNDLQVSVVIILQTVKNILETLLFVLKLLYFVWKNLKAWNVSIT